MENQNNTSAPSRDYPHVTLCIDTTTEIGHRLYAEAGKEPFAFISIGSHFDLWGHSAKAFHRVADACRAAAAALDGVHPSVAEPELESLIRQGQQADLGIYGDSAREQREGAALDAEIQRGQA